MLGEVTHTVKIYEEKSKLVTQKTERMYEHLCCMTGVSLLIYLNGLVLLAMILFTFCMYTKRYSISERLLKHKNKTKLTKPTKTKKQQEPLL